MLTETLRGLLAEAQPGGPALLLDLGDAGPADLYVGAGDLVAVHECLRGVGLTLAGTTWAGVVDGRVNAVRPSTHAQWQELCADLTPGRALTAPSPAHVLLLSAERLVTDDAVESQVLGSIAAHAVAESPESWRAALRRGLDWGLWRALAHLERAMAGATVTARDRSDARRELERARHHDLRVKPSTPLVIALSGVDGAGKSLQARQLAAALSAAGAPAAVEWGRVAADRRLDAIALPVAAVASRVSRRSARSVEAAPARAAVVPEARVAARQMRERSRLVGLVWPYLVVLLTITSQRRVTRLHRAQGRSVIHDRYVLDAVTQLRDDYRVRAGTFARAALRRLAPRPAVAVLLVVSPEVALARKQEQYDLDDLKRIHAGYLEAAKQLAVAQVDGERDPAVITAELFGLAWAALTQR